MSDKPWKRNCPKCGKELSYTLKENRNSAERRGSLCSKCSHPSISFEEIHGKERASELRERYSRERSGKNNPFYGKAHTSESLQKMKGRTVSEEGRRNMTGPRPSISGENNPMYGVRLTGSLNPMYGKTHTPESIEKMKRNRTILRGEHSPHYGNSPSDETRRKMRVSAINRMTTEFGTVMPSFNPTACQLIDEYGNEHGFNFQHAMNGGEFHITDLGYFVDGYDEEKNVVIEYYEMAHKRTKKRDARRKKEIVEHLGCEFIELKEWEL